MEIINGYEPSKKQLRFHNSTAKFRAIITGVGFGKSAAGSNEILITALKYPKSLHLILAPNSKIMTHATLTQFWKFCPKEVLARHVMSKNMIYLKNGAKIIYLTADNERHIDRLRGMEIGSFWCDESRLFLPYIWEIILTRLRERNGPLKGIVTTTPHGYDWLYYYFVKKIHPKTKKPLKNAKDYEWFGGSTLDNPYTPKEYKENLLSQLSGKFAKQEIYGEFTGFEGMVYDNFSYEQHVLKEKVNLSKLKSIIAGLDFGFTNKTACMIIGIDSDDRCYVIDEYYRSRQDIEDVGKWIIRKIGEYPKLSSIYADPSEPMMINKLQGMGLNIIKAKNEVMAGINFVYSLFDIKEDGKPRLFINQECGNLLDELNSYRYAEVKEDKFQKEEPLKVNDHACDALRYALFTHLGSNQGYVFLEDPDGVLF